MLNENQFCDTRHFCTIAVLTITKNCLRPKQKASPGSKESLRSICARFGGVSAHLISINMILYAFNKELCFRFPNTHFFCY